VEHYILEIHKLINSVWGRIAQQWKESIIVLLYRKGDETGCSNYQGLNFIQNFIAYPLRVKPICKKSKVILLTGHGGP
jgi:hypothetical protein